MKDFILYHFCLLGPPSTIPFIWTFNPVIFFFGAKRWQSLSEEKGLMSGMFWSVVRHMIIEPLAPLGRAHVWITWESYIFLYCHLDSSLYGAYFPVSWLSHWKKYVITFLCIQFSSVQSLSVSDSLRPLGLQYARLPCPSQTQTHVHWVGDAIQPDHPLLSPSPHAFTHSQRQGLYKWVSSSHQVAKVLEFQLQHQSFQWIFRTDLL